MWNGSPLPVCRLLGAQSRSAPAGVFFAHLYTPAWHEAPATPGTPTTAPPASLAAWRHLIPGDCPLYLYLFIMQLLHDAAAEDLQGSHDISFWA